MAKEKNSIKTLTVNKMKFSIEKLAEKKANSNCLGFMYEPVKPAKLINEGK